MGRFKTIIKETAEAAGCPYHYGSWARLNQDLDKFVHAGVFPAVLHLEHTAGSVTFSDGIYDTRARTLEQVNLGIGEMIELDYDSEQVGERVDALIDLGKGIIASLSERDDVELSTPVSYQVLYDQFDANLVVVMFSFSMQDLTGECYGKDTESE